MSTHHPVRGSASSPEDLAVALTTGRFDFTESEVEADCSEFRVEGELDLAVSNRLHRALEGCRNEQILIDLEPCSFIDSSGIAIILNARREGNRVAIHSPSDQVLRVLEVCGLAERGFVFSSREQALAAGTPCTR